MTDQEKLEKIRTLHRSCPDYFIRQFMDPDNPDHLDWKLEVLEALRAGKKPPEIEHYDDVQDLYPEKEEPLNLDVRWD